MALQWIRLDTSVFQNIKIIDLISDGKHRAIVVHLAAMCWVGQQGMDGFVPDRVLPLIHGKPLDARQLVAVGLWKVVPGGWSINGWDEFQISDEDAKKRRDRAQRAALKRWHPDED